jgi:hypothetical protein
MKRLALLTAILTILLTACGPAATPVPTDPPPTATAAPTLPPTLAPTETPAPPFALTSSAFEDGGDIPDQYTYKMGSQCDGENISLPIAWVGTPAGTQSLTISGRWARGWHQGP